MRLEPTAVSNNSASTAIDDKLSPLFQADSVLAAQFFDQLRPTTVLEPEKRLMLAVLEEGISAFQQNLGTASARKKRDFDESAEWIFGSDGDWVFSFESVCGALGLDPEYLRAGLRRWRRVDVSSPRVDEHRIERLAAI